MGQGRAGRADVQAIGTDELDELNGLLNELLLRSAKPPQGDRLNKARGPRRSSLGIASSEHKTENAMPTYTCTAAAGFLDAAQKGAIARVVTLAHAEITGAPTHFAQVIFQEVPEGDHFMGGVPLEHASVFVYGRIRDGRSAGRPQGADQAVDGGCRRGGEGGTLCRLGSICWSCPPPRWWSLATSCPKAGDEPTWTAALPADDRAAMENIQARLAR